MRLYSVLILRLVAALLDARDEGRERAGERRAATDGEAARTVRALGVAHAQEHHRLRSARCLEGCRAAEHPREGRFAAFPPGEPRMPRSRATVSDIHPRNAARPPALAPRRP